MGQVAANQEHIDALQGACKNWHKRCVSLTSVVYVGYRGNAKR
jgi:hypothetical protein